MALKESAPACTLAIISGKLKASLLQEPKHIDLSWHLDRKSLHAIGWAPRDLIGSLQETKEKLAAIFDLSNGQRGYINSKQHNLLWLLIELSVATDEIPLESKLQSCRSNSLVKWQQPNSSLTVFYWPKRQILLMKILECLSKKRTP